MLAATEYYARRGNSWRYSRLSAAIAIAIYAFSNYLTLVCLYYAATGRLPRLLIGMGPVLNGLFILLVVLVVWLVSGSIRSGTAVGISEAGPARSRIWRRYYLGSVLALLLACALVLVRMG